MNSRLIILIGLVISPAIFFGQKNVTPNNLWSLTSSTQTIDYQGIETKDKKIYSLNITQLTNQINRPTNHKALSTNTQHNIISLPLPDGTFHEFEIHTTQVMHPALAAKYPAIKTFRGHSLEHPEITLRADLSSKGFHAMIMGTKNGTSFIEPLRNGSQNEYIVFSKNTHQHHNDWGCSAHEVNDFEKDFLAQPNLNRNPDCKLRTYRLALACTGEYAQYHGGSVDGALAAMASTLNRVNGIFERDLGVHLEMVANNDEIIFLLPNADPFSNTNGSAMLAENQTLCDNVIGTENYDVGHVFSTGGGGIAIVASVCSDYSKANGVTGSPFPEGEAFDIDYVAHELGHQFGANHTQNNPCNCNAATSVEPGSGSTIMSYAGVCAPNIQVQSDAYFHAISIGEIKNHLSGSGNSCASISGDDHCPTADAGTDYTLPRSTPFVLTAHSTDPDTDDELTYTWEQMDNQAALMPPVAGNSAGPAFRSLPPSIEPARFFPNMTAILRGEAPIWEVLPSQARSLNFTLTVRDNHVNGGCTAQDDITLTIDGEAGPFKILQPSENTTWVSSRNQSVNWDVAMTDQAPIECSEVDILLSVNGGETWDFILAEAAANDGEHEIVVPNYPTTAARIMVRSRGNIFFAISEADFSIIESSEFSANVIKTDVNCFGEKNGAASVVASGGEGNYKYTWNTGDTQPSLTMLTTGNYTVTISSGNQEIVKEVNIEQPDELTLKLIETEANQGSNGQIQTQVKGGSGNYDYLWNNGRIQAHLTNITAGKYSVTVTDENGCADSKSMELGGTPPLPLEYGTIENVGASWQIIELKNDYEKMVVVTSIELPEKGTASVVSRVKATQGNKFELKIQRAGNSDYDFQPVKIHYMVAEEGTYREEEYGVNFEAKRVTSNQTSSSGKWLYGAKKMENEYDFPVVLGQVMGYNDHKWSAFWSSKINKRNQAPTASSFSIGKHAGQDERKVDGPTDEIGYFVFETGSGFINGKRFIAAVGKDKVKGLADAQYGYTYAFSGFTDTEMAIVSAAGMDDDEGAWPVISDNTPTESTLSLFSMEDQCRDNERSHATEQVAYIVFGEADLENTDNQSNNNTVSERPDPETYLHAYPTPSNGLINLEFFQSELGGPEIVISDFFGRVRDKFTLIHSKPGLRKVQLDLSMLETGTYILQLWEGKSRKTIKIILI